MGTQDYQSLPRFAQGVAAAHNEVDQAVTATKTRRKGLFGKKEEPRNRSVVSHYVAHATAMAAGGGRVADAASFSASIVSDARGLSGADFRGNEAAPVKAMLRDAGMSLSALDSGIATYRRQLATALSTLPQTKHADRAELVEAIKKIDGYLEKAKEKLTATKKLDPQRIAAQIVARPG
jgi:hypothetical protein